MALSHQHLASIFWYLEEEPLTLERIDEIECDGGSHEDQLLVRFLFWLTDPQSTDAKCGEFSLQDLELMASGMSPSKQARVRKMLSELWADPTCRDLLNRDRRSPAHASK
jgi:hypothetical protein